MNLDVGMVGSNGKFVLIRIIPMSKACTFEIVLSELKIFVVNNIFCFGFSFMYSL